MVIVEPPQLQLVGTDLQCLPESKQGIHHWSQLSLIKPTESLNRKVLSTYEWSAMKDYCCQQQKS